MNTSPKKNIIIDPDYEVSEVEKERVRLKEQKDSKAKLEKLIEIIDREFEGELEHRQSQLRLIQERITEAQKTLQLLRYVLITSYYNENEKLSAQIEDNEASGTSAKTRLHPAVKKLLGRDVKDPKLQLIGTPRKRFKQERAPELQQEVNLPITTVSNDAFIPTESVVNPSGVVKEFDTGRNRKKSKYQIVVGNISKWIPSTSEEDKSTHKWMVYVRGPKDHPNISHFVQKVVFYLHPSYQPNDVIELSDTPYHLSRRGWGEFPLRVKIFFRCPLNKPVDIIHNLVLDKSYSGRQTLGNETVVNLLLYNKNQLTDQNKRPPEADVVIKTEPEAMDSEEPSIMPLHEHDYCFTSVKQEMKQEEFKSEVIAPHLCEHSYFSTANPLVKQNNQMMKTIETVPSNNDLIYGIADNPNECKPNVIVETVLDDVKSPQSNGHKLIISNGMVHAIRKRKRVQESLLKSIFQKKYKKYHAVSILKQPLIDYNKYKIEFPSQRFKNVPETLSYLFKHLPIINDLASDLNYKCTYPYTSKSQEEYASWNIGRRLSCEWLQAKTMLNILKRSQIPLVENWTVKSVIMYGKSHGYTPLCNYKIFNYTNEHIRHIFNGQTGKERMHVPERIDRDVLIDVVNCNRESSSPISVLHKEKVFDYTSAMACSFVKHTLLDVGVILKPEEILPGVIINGAERMLLQAALSLAEDLIRRARSNLIFKGNFQEDTSTISIEDVKMALHQRFQFDVFGRNTDT